MVNHQPSYGIIFISFLSALILTIIPLSTANQIYNPQWLILISAYWSIHHPERVGIVTCWFWGLLLDVTLGSHMGIHALSVALVCYMCIILHQRLRMFPIWQQSLFIWLLCALDKLVVLQLSSIFSPIEVQLNYWTSAFVTAMIWPICVIFIRRIPYSH